MPEFAGGKGKQIKTFDSSKQNKSTRMYDDNFKLPVISPVSHYNRSPPDEAKSSSIPQKQGMINSSFNGRKKSMPETKTG